MQGLDYAYTLQGWLKGVNSTALNTSHDMGGDALISGTHQYVAKDAYGFNLNYFTGEYASINTTVTPFPGHSGYLSSGEYRPLYNGNISSMAVNIDKFNQPQLYNYQYDQLNRIVSMDVYRGLNESSNSWSALTSTTDYKERIAYDGNGNILKYLRNGTVAGGSSLAMDSLTYKYNWSSGKLQNNKLRHVNDQTANTANYTVDIDNQADDNYLYDEIGNLIKDNAEGIDDIDWTVYGKIDKITKSNGTEIKYHYDVAGNRITKAVTAGGQTAYTSYVRDASGNVMGVYEQASGSEVMKLKEHHLYGSSRLGIWSRDLDIDQPKQVVTEEELLGDSYVVNFERGYKFFELSNHLGNVLTTISDKKNGVDDGSNGTIDYYTTDVMTANDYYPFGMLMPGRKFSVNSEYRFGFNGQEKSLEVNSDGNSMTAEFWQYDARVARRWNIDPIKKEYESPYASLANSPLMAIDPNGADTTLRVSDGKLDIRTFAPNAEAESCNCLPSNDQLNKILPKGAVVEFISNGRHYSASIAQEEKGDWVFDGYIDENGEVFNPNVPTKLIYDVKFIHASLVDGDIPTQDKINIGLTMTAQGVDNAKVYSKQIRDELLNKSKRNLGNSYYRRALKDANGSLKTFEKAGKRLGAAGIIISGGFLVDKYFNGDGISRKDLFDFGTSALLLTVTASTPIGWIALAAYSILDAVGALDKLKKSIGIDDTKVLERENK